MANAQSLEKAWALLDELGLREKLVKYFRIHNPQLETLFLREPLKIKKQLHFQENNASKLVLKHGTKSLEDYFNMIRNKEGLPNFFISRPYAHGELASKGTGVYASDVSNEKFRVGVISIYLEVSDQAKIGNHMEDEKSDIVKIGDEYIIKNLGAVRLSELNFNLSTENFIQLSTLKDLELEKALEMLHLLKISVSDQQMLELMKECNASTFSILINSRIFSSRPSLRKYLIEDERRFELALKAGFRFPEDFLIPLISRKREYLDLSLKENIYFNFTNLPDFERSFIDEQLKNKVEEVLKSRNLEDFRRLIHSGLLQYSPDSFELAIKEFRLLSDYIISERSGEELVKNPVNPLI